MTSDSIGSGHDAAAVGTDTDHAYPHGHIGNLTPDQEAAFSQFKSAAEERGLYESKTPSHTDEDLLRYLRARKWNIEDGLQQFADTIAWRKANDLDVLYQTIELDAYEQSRRMYPQWTGRRDKRGIPLYVYNIKTLDSKNASAYEKACASAATTFSKARPSEKNPPSLMRLFALYENLTRFSMPLCTQLRDREHATTPISIGTNIVDVSGVGLKQFWDLKSHMQAASQLATAHYPETLDRIYIIGAPFFFSTVWGWIKKWFDPVTVSKIFILSDKDVKPTLTKFIDPKNLPTQYGGELEWKFGEQPTVDPEWDGVIEWAPGHSSFVSSPCVWEEVDGGTRLACIGLGAVGGKERRELICTIPKTFPTTGAAPPSPVADGVEQQVPTTSAPVANGHVREDTDASSSTTATYVTPPTGASSIQGDNEAIVSGQALKGMTLNEKDHHLGGEPTQATATEAMAPTAMPTTVI
jgi:hypothetical protein